MANKKRPRSAASVTGLHLWCREVLAGIAALDRGPVAGSVAPLQSAADRALQLRDKNALKQIALELREWVRALSIEQQSSIETRVRSKLGLGLTDIVPQGETVIAETIARGFIETEHEFRVIEARVIDAVGEPRSGEEVRVLNALLEDYVRRRRSGP